MSLQKVQIQKYENGNWVDVFDTGDAAIAARFNPDKLQLSKSSTWKTEKVPHANIGVTTFGGGDPMSLSIDLFFDTTKTGQDVRKYIAPLLELTMVSAALASAYTSLYQAQQQAEEQEEGSGAMFAFQMNAFATQPPRCKFIWGSFTSFQAYVESVNVTFTMFLQDGTPVRARAKVKLKQIEDTTLQPPQNPTTRSAARKTWVVGEGERLDWIAYQEYGDPALWRYLARANNLDDPKDLRPGQVLDLTLAS